MPGYLSLLCHFLDLSFRNFDETICLNPYRFGFCLLLQRLFYGLCLDLDASLILLLLVLMESGSRSHLASRSALTTAVGCSEIKFIEGRFISLLVLLFRGLVVACFSIPSGSLPALLFPIFVLKLL